MRVAVFSDAHGNLEYLQTCLSDLNNLEGIDKRLFLGDAVGYGANSLGCIRTLVDEGFELLKGNHEAMLLGELKMDESKQEIYNLHRGDILEDCVRDLQLKDVAELVVDGQRMLFVHGSPWDHLLGYLYFDTPIQKRLPENTQWVFMGHTHRPFIRKIEQTTLVNVGSCGMPRDVGNLPSYAIYDSEKNCCEIRRPRVSRKFVLEHYNDVHREVKACLLR